MEPAAVVQMQMGCHNNGDIFRTDIDLRETGQQARLAAGHVGVCAHLRRPGALHCLRVAARIEQNLSDGRICQKRVDRDSRGLGVRLGCVHHGVVPPHDDLPQIQHI